MKFFKLICKSIFYEMSRAIMRIYIEEESKKEVARQVDMKKREEKEYRGITNKRVRKTAGNKLDRFFY